MSSWESRTRGQLPGGVLCVCDPAGPYTTEVPSPLPGVSDLLPFPGKRLDRGVGRALRSVGTPQKRDSDAGRLRVFLVKRRDPPTNEIAGVRGCVDLTLTCV